MRKLSTNSLSPGVKLAVPVYNVDGVVLVQRGRELDQGMINKIRSYGVANVYVHEEDFSGESILDIVSHQTRATAIKTLKEWIFNLEENKYSKLKLPALNSLVERLLGELKDNRDKCVKFLDIRTIDNYTYAHCVNVCILSLITGMSLGYTDQELGVLGMAALLHDIGKSLLPNNLLNKEGQFDNEENQMMKKHPQLGYELVLEDPMLNPVIAEIIFQHHERYDGSGYPRNLKGNQILQSAYIVAVADVFDALTQDRSYRNRFLPHEAIEYLYGAGNHYFDYNVVKAFVQHVALYPLGTKLLLSNNEEGVVIDINPKLSSRPKVRIIDNNKIKRNYPKIIDLMSEPTVMIKKVLSEGAKKIIN